MSTRLIILIDEGPSVERLYSEHTEEVGGDDASIHALRLAATEQAECHLVEFDHRIQGVVLRAIVFDFFDREQHVVDANRRSALLQMNQVIAAGERQGLDQDGVRCHKRRRARANGHTKNGDHDDGERDGPSSSCAARNPCREKDLPMLPKCSGEQAAACVPTEAGIGSAAGVSGILSLVAEDRPHLAPEMLAEFRRKEAQQAGRRLAVQSCARNLFWRFPYSASGVLRTQNMLQARQRQYPLHAFGFGFGHRFAQLRQPIVAAPLVVEAEVRTLRRLFNHVVVEKPLDDAVECAGAQLDFIVGPARDFLTDDIAVLFAIGQRQQYIEQRRCQRQIRFDRSSFFPMNFPFRVDPSTLDFDRKTFTSSHSPLHSHAIRCTST